MFMTRRKKYKPIGSRSKKVRAGDRVAVITGNCKGQHGIVLRARNDRVLIQGINLRKKHVRRSEKNPQGGVVPMEGWLHLSNVSPCDIEGNVLKVKVSTSNGERKLSYNKNGETIVWRSIKHK